MIARWQKNRLFFGLTAVLLALLAWVAYVNFSERRLRAGLAEAARDMEAGNRVGSRDRLARLAERWPGRGEILFHLGESELACGRVEPALIAWSNVPHGSEFSAAAALQRAQLAIQTGQFTNAESILRKGLDEPGPQAAGVRHLLLAILGQQGRLDEATQIIEELWRRPVFSPAERLVMLREHLALELETIPLEGNLAFLQLDGPEVAGDDRLWLARANLAARSGRLEESSRWLDAAILRRPDDPVVWRARLEWALAARRLDRVREALAHLRVGELSPERTARIPAWLASQGGDKDEEKRALEKLLVLIPADGAALDRLAELAFQTGQKEAGSRLRERKADLDRVKDRYHRLFKQDHLLETGKEMADLAIVLGRGFEARAFLTLIHLNNPGDHAVPAPLEILAPLPSERPSRSGETLARLFEHELARAQGQTTRGMPGRESVLFEDDAGRAGLAAFVQNNGESPSHQLPEMSCGGIGLIDYDGDGFLDIYAVQGGAFPPPAGGLHSGDRLFRNRGNGAFEDVTKRSGLGGVPGGYGHGASVGDFDNDGHPDLFVTRWRSYALYRNRNDGTFEDVTAKAGLGGDRDWPTSSAFVDLDNDGDLDLYVCHYGIWDAVNPPLCKDPSGRINISCDPRSIAALPDHVFRNDNGQFVDVTALSGVLDRDGRGLGVVAADLDGDGLAEVFVANDSTANFLFHNLGGFRFEEVGQSAGVAANAGGGYQAGMGVACGDWDGDGLVDLAVTNFYGESTTLFRNLGQGLFADHTAAAGLAASSRYMLGFGIAFLDADNDGHLDLMTANGHVSDLRPHFPFAMTAQLYSGGADGQLSDITSLAGPPFQRLHVGRGLAVGDLDNDGRMDAVLVAHNEPPVYFHNRTASVGGHYLTLALQGTKSNRDGVGAVVTVTAGGRKQVAQRFGGGSYQSAGDPRLHFGVGTARRIDRVDVRWPSGRVDVFEDLPVDKRYHLTEGAQSPGVLAKTHR